MMIKKPFGKEVLSIILVIVITITPFSFVKADTYTTDDLYYKLRDIITILNGYNQNMPTEGINDQIDELNDLFDHIFNDNTYSYVDGAAGLVEHRTFMQLLQSIASLSFSIPSTIMEGYILTDEGGNIHHINGLQDDLTTIENYLSLLNDVGIADNNFLRTLVSDVFNILLKVNTIATTLSNILTADNNILNLETNFYNYIQNGTFKFDLDNAIDTITWSNITIDNTNFWYSLNGSEWVQIISGSSDTLLSSEIIYFRIKLPSSWPLNYNNSLFRFALPIRNYTMNRDFTAQAFVSSNGTTLNESSLDVKYINYSLYTVNCYFEGLVSSGAYIILKVFNNTQNRIYLNTSRSDFYSFKYFFDSDIEYWDLMSYFDLHKLLLDYESVNSSELDKLKQENQQFNNTLQNFNNLETQISTDFSNDMVTFNSNLTESTNMFNSLTVTVTWFSQQLQNIFDVSDRFKMILIMPMILGIALWFIGRGSYILRSPGKNGKENRKN